MQPWAEECAKLNAMGLSYELLGEKYGVTRNAVAGEIYRFRHRGRRDEAERIRSRLYRERKSNARFRRLLAARQTAVDHLLACVPIHNPRYKQVVLAFAKGMSCREIGKAAGYSHWNAIMILRRYGLDTSEKIHASARERVLGKDRGNADLQISPEISPGSRWMGSGEHV